ncbi:hypothetical protein E2562_021482 [Oryza meyeriana var. granulata]|uniref:Uncharacterized protein n=1 Tax=Oryza meyeriana var. granulata TaxID=110450 RepID=A0A6G1DZ66_9ORYZ|nr:hypothetical protein E2562_021482 [Oryza meyeriana var. granulata]
MKRKRPARRGEEETGEAAAATLKRGPWTPEEDEVLARFVAREGCDRWRTLPRRAGLLRCGKSCRLRWMNYLRPDIKRSPITGDEEDLILRLHRLLGNRWSLIAGRLPGRTDNEIKNYWNSHLSKRLIAQGIDPRTHKPLMAAADQSHAAAASDKRTVPTEPRTMAPPSTVQPSCPAAGIGGSDDRARPADGGGDFAAMVSAADAEGFKGFGDQLCAEDAARGGFDMGSASTMVGDDEFSSFLDSLINDEKFVDYLVIEGNDHEQGNGDIGQGDVMEFKQ